MKLYHYSFKDLIEDGLDPYYKHPDTKTINNLIKDKYNECFGRDYCVFLNTSPVDYGEYLYSIDSLQLDSKQLFIADQSIANDIYSAWYRGNDVSNLVKAYVDSINAFSEEALSKYDYPEVFYTDYISNDLLEEEVI